MASWQAVERSHPFVFVVEKGRLQARTPCIGNHDRVSASSPGQLDPRPRGQAHLGRQRVVAVCYKL